jgi:glutamyl-Q tRNA(Asp) synthetase
VSYRGRFAPSPTGPLHFGSLVAALASWLDARAAGGAWLLRIEDVDETRSVPGAAEDIVHTLESLALEWDGEIAWQSRRKALYEAALQQLLAAGRVYRCRCSRREIADSGWAGVEGIVYPGTCRGASLAQESGTAMRLRTAPGRVDFLDRLQGALDQDVAQDVGDFVVKRRDGLHAYQLAVVVDDHEQGITDVVRGADLLWSTPRQILLQHSLGYATPRYLHFPVACDALGEKLSKQTRAEPIARGDMQALRAALSFLGQPVPNAANVRELLAQATSAWNIESIPRRRSIAMAGS